MLVPPSIDQFYQWKRELLVEPIPQELEVSLDDFLQAATDLMEMATGLSEAPSDQLGQRVMLRGILDMAWYLGTSIEERDALFSPFSSERIGSYSYSKMQTVVSLSGITGVPFFDLAVAYFADRMGTGDAWSNSERVMPDSLAESRDPLGLMNADNGVLG